MYIRLKLQRIEGGSIANGCSALPGIYSEGLSEDEGLMANIRHTIEWSIAATRKNEGLLRYPTVQNHFVVDVWDE